MGVSFQGMEGMEGMQGMVGLAAGLSAGGTGVYPDRIDLPFVTIEQLQSTGIYKPISDNRSWLPSFSKKAWTTEWYAWLVLTEFVQVSGWNAYNLLPAWAQSPPSSNNADWTSAGAKAVVGQELDDLVTAARDERPDALGEILAQNTGCVGYFLNLLSVPNSYPATDRLLRIANFIAGFCAMYYKGKYERPRPSMVCPALLSAIDVPGHASFPSGHSTQAHLIALCMKDVLAGKGAYAPILDDLTALAGRIARNREIAGLHYKSDTEAGIKLATHIHALLTPLQTAGSWYQTAFDAATGEWS
jgi:hypothetical protein